MATHSGILAWRIPETEELSGLLSMGSHKVGHDGSNLAAAAAAAAAALTTGCFSFFFLRPHSEDFSFSEILIL